MFEPSILVRVLQAASAEDVIVTTDSVEESGPPECWRSITMCSVLSVQLHQKHECVVSGCAAKEHRDNTAFDRPVLKNLENNLACEMLPVWQSKHGGDEMSFQFTLS